MHETGRLIGASFALTGFAVAVAAGLMAGNPAVTIVSRAIVVLLICRAVGGFLGYIGTRVAQDAMSSARAIDQLTIGTDVAADPRPMPVPAEVKNAA